MQERNQKIIDAIIEKANRECPGALAMIGIYGSFMTGDVHEKSDLDLMILVNDDRGYALAHCFILDDEGIGHDLYCTTWETLAQDAKFTHPHLAKLMDSKIVYCADDAHRIRLEALQKQAMEADTQASARKALTDAESAFAKAIVAANLADCRSKAGEMLYRLTEAIALRNKQYFRLGTRRLFQEIDAMECRPADFQALATAVVSALNIAELKDSLPPVLQAVENLFHSPAPVPEVYPGTYEEMFSNWRNKMYLAAQTNDTYLSFDCMGNLDAMLKDLGFFWNIMDQFDPTDLHKSAKAYDDILARYLEEYRKTDTPVQRYPDVDAFINEYEKKKA